MAVTGSRIDPTGNGGTISITTDISGNLSAIPFNIVTPPSNFTRTFPAGQIINANELLSTPAATINTVNMTPGNARFVRASGGNLHSIYGAWASIDVGTGRSAANETAGVWKVTGGGITAVGSYGASR
jgi:hypothetical protein